MSKPNVLTEIPIVCFISTYREGKLPRGAIRSALKATPHIIVFEGLTESEHVEGEATSLGRQYRQYLKEIAVWKSETEKRNAMLAYARRFFRNDFWILILDGDEILVWGEYLRDWLDVLKPGADSAENVVPLKRTEASTAWIENEDGVKVTNGIYTDIAPSRLYHSSIIHSYYVGCWQFHTPDGQIAVMSHRQSDRPPAYGEPHIHHRSYLRRHDRAEFRARDHEEKRWLKENTPSVIQNLTEEIN